MDENPYTPITLPPNVTFRIVPIDEAVPCKTPLTPAQAARLEEIAYTEEPEAYRRNGVENIDVIGVHMDEAAEGPGGSIYINVEAYGGIYITDAYLIHPDGSFDPNEEGPSLTDWGLYVNDCQVDAAEAAAESAAEYRYEMRGW